ncbi:hypothetical protein [Lutibacter sp.]
MTNSLKYLLVTFFTFVVGYLFLRFAYYQTSQIPYAQEIVLIVLGTIATMAVTAALISKQSEVEIQKEQRVKVFELKSELYIELINFIEKIITKGNITKNDLVSLEFLTHKISIVANPEVLLEYSNFIDTVKQIANDTKISALESDELSVKLAKLCGKIRYDLILKDTDYKVNVEELIQKNVTKL